MAAGEDQLLELGEPSNEVDAPLVGAENLREPSPGDDDGVVVIGSDVIEAGG